MSIKESTPDVQQFEQGQPVEAGRAEKVSLHERYKSIGISAVSAAASIKRRKKDIRSTEQMG